MIIYLLLGLIIGCVIAFVVYFFLNKQLKDVARENITLRTEVEGKNTRISDFICEKTRLESDLRNAEAKLATQKEELAQLREEFNKEFKLLANQIFEEKTQKFSQVNEEKLSNILNPLKERIQTFEKKVEETYNHETREKASLRKELEQIININRQMSIDAQNLTHALKGDSKTQGDWGEWQLELLLEKSGLQKGIHFMQQQNFKTEDGANIRPDYVVNLPEGKHYIIDSKVSLTAYEKYFNEENLERQQTYLQQHIKSVQQHINDLGSKNYQNLYEINSPDFVFMFIALEPALTVALQNDSSLFEKAFQKNIVIVSTTTLLASMRTVSFIWKQENQKNNVLEIAKESGFLYDKFVGFTEDLLKVGKNLIQTKDLYDAAMNKLTTSTRKGDTIIGRMENIKKLGANANKTIESSLLNRSSINDDNSEGEILKETQSFLEK